MSASRQIGKVPLCNREIATLTGKENRVLASLPPDRLRSFAPYFKWVSLGQGRRLHEPGEPIRDIYFPIDCLISITITLSDGVVVETGIVGNREMLGISAFLAGREAMQTETTVQIAGSAVKIDAQIMQSAFNRDQQVRDVLLRYAQAFIVQVSQTAVCNRAHVLDQRMARWLLEAQDRINSTELRLTHEFIANMLGVRRAGVTQAAQKLQDKGLIQYHRGHIRILDLAGLEASACECFRTVRCECDRLFKIKSK